MKKQKRVLMVIAPEGFRDEEYREPRRILEEKGCAVIVASSTTSPSKGMLGMVVTPDLALGGVSAADFDAVIFVGGSGAQVFFDDRKAQALAVETLKSGKPLGAICVAPTILANAGVLKGRQATVWPSQAGALTAGGATCTGHPVEKDGSIITADGPTSAAKFGDEIARALGL